VAGLQWVVDAYTVALAGPLLLGGSLGDRFGSRRMFLTALVAFTLASAGCALAPSLGGAVGIALLGALVAGGRGFAAGMSLAMLTAAVTYAAGATLSWSATRSADRGPPSRPTRRGSPWGRSRWRWRSRRWPAPGRPSRRWTGSGWS
jgi:MFS transporter, DHA2 family, methylenomycin A resistance protein